MWEFTTVKCVFNASSMDLDTLLVQLSESHGIRTKVVDVMELRGVQVEGRGHTGSLLPKVVKRGAAEMWG